MGQWVFIAVFGSAGKIGNLRAHPDFWQQNCRSRKAETGAWSTYLRFSPHFRNCSTEVCGKFRNPRAHCPFHEKNLQVDALPLSSVVDVSRICRTLPDLHKLDWFVYRLGQRNLVWTSLYVFKWMNLTYKLSSSRNGRCPLVEGYDLVECRDLKGRPFWELTASPDNSQFQKMLSDPKRKLTARTMIGQNSTSASGI